MMALKMQAEEVNQCYNVVQNAKSAFVLEAGANQALQLHKHYAMMWDCEQKDAALARRLAGRVGPEHESPNPYMIHNISKGVSAMRLTDGGAAVAGLTSREEEGSTSGASGEKTELSQPREAAGQIVTDIRQLDRRKIWWG